jgi:quercetin dioxygenase-like cupin family protein
MSKPHFPDLIRNLPAFDGPFDAFRLVADGCEVLFGSYPAGTVIEPHTHPTENVGVVTEGELILTRSGETTRHAAGDWYHLDPEEEHAAQFDVDCSTVEFWFTVDGQ